MRAYSDNGLAFRAWEDPAHLAAGEVYFDHAPTDTELAAAFPNFASAKVAAQAPSIFAGLLAGGLAITSTATPTLNATYGVNFQDELNVVSMQTAVLTDATLFPGYWRDTAGLKVSMTPAQFTTIAEAILAFVKAADDWLDAALLGGTASPPAAAATIA
jgi:hypothetical protein